MTQLTYEFKEALFKKIREDAAQRKTDAGYGGEWGDRGAADLLDQMKYFEYGATHTIPPQWKKYADQVQKDLDNVAKEFQEALNQQDPEYAEWERLQKKFKK